MRKLIVQELVSLDGYFAGPNGEIDWHGVDDEYGEYANGQRRFVPGAFNCFTGRSNEHRDQHSGTKRSGAG
ncbi:hypothetical protein PACILC2_34420 [Paenibacillus cisolokensis]|uniref:Bacterial bifunctional deaminase-reductase C-terminal domain-containing protein n=1 Tax=Paenibacillus cisolokensis TaxID=1658519 RepID=A0ABQ4N9G5_9BACL|nr:hypothetical protein [Paenibacillus cisolokensis]GIQ64874.1 hypothetical protein PACILC2_34420 [Paenibacillus cisolokensis]